MIDAGPDVCHMIVAQTGRHFQPRHKRQSPPIRRQAQETLAGVQQIATLPLPQVAARKAYVRARQRTPALHR